MAQKQEVLPLGSIFWECLEVGLWWVKAATRERLFYHEMQRTTSRTASTRPRWTGKSWGRNGVVMLTRRLMYIEDEVIHNPVNLGRHRLLLCCVLLHRYIGGRLYSSHCNQRTCRQVPPATGEKGTCEQEVCMQTSFTGTLKTMNKTGLLYESPVMSWRSGTGALFLSWDQDLLGILCVAEFLCEVTFTKYSPNL